MVKYMLDEDRRAYSRAWYRKNREKCKAAGDRWRARNREKVASFPSKSPSNDRKRHLMYKYGLTEEVYESMLQSQGGVCKLCESTCSTGQRLAVDHNHDTGKIRGLLCIACNRSLGQFKDSPELLRKAAEYLEAT